ncbi:MAG: sodium:calcium antiporter [Solirubrobacterales bacterium]
MGAAILLALSFAIILAGALLFTNAIEWFGHRLGIGVGAVGSLLAAVGTAMPESIIPIVAIIRGGEGSDEVAIGAIVGAPFLLATIAMFLVGLFAILYVSRRAQGTQLTVHVPTLDRDLLFFLVFFAIALGLGLGVPDGVRYGAAVLFVLAYGVYVRRTLRGGGDVQAKHTLDPLIIDRTRREEEPKTQLIVLQLLIGLAAIIGGANLFVEELISVAESVGVDVLVLSLILAPLATELPEKANSFFWIREGKDTLALGNITGAMVFQSTLPVAIGLAFTDWDLDGFALLSMALALAGGIVAYWALRLRSRFTVPAIVAWAALYIVFVVAVIV